MRLSSFQTGPISTHKQYAWLLLIVTVIVPTLYWPGLNGSLTFDDRPNLLDNQALQLFDGTFPSLIDAATSGLASPLGRPLSMASFAFDFYLHGGDPFYFKLANLLLHLVNGVLIFFLARHLWPRLVGGERGQLAALWVAALWLLHPLNLTSVLYVVQRMTSLAALFTLLALNLYLYGRAGTGARRWLAIGAAGLLCWPAGVLAKESALLLPLFILVCEWLALGGLRTRRAQFLVAALVLAALGLLAANWQIVAGGYAVRDFTLHERLLTEARVLWFHILQILLPWLDVFSLHHDYVAISRGWLTPPSTLLAALAWTVAVALAWFARARWPLFTFALAWYLAAHALESTLLPLEIVHEHRNYLASFGFLFWLASLLFPAKPNKSAHVVRYALAAAFLFYCGLVTHMRAMQWGDEYRRTQIEVALHPESARAHHEAATVILERTIHGSGGNSLAVQMARHHFQKESELDPRSKAGLLGLLYLDCLTGAPKNPEMFRQLRERYAHARFSHNDKSVTQSLSELFVEGRLCLDDTEIRTLIEAGLSNPSGDGIQRAMLHGVAMDYAAAKLGNIPLAIQHARAAVAHNPGSAPLRINLIRLLYGSNERDAARREYAALAGLRIPPQDREEVGRMGVLLNGAQPTAN